MKKILADTVVALIPKGRHIENTKERKASMMIIWLCVFAIACLTSKMVKVEAKGEPNRIKNILIEQGIGDVEEPVYENKLFFTKDRNLENEATDFIIKFEGFSSVPYPDLGGDYSIGFGQPANDIKSITRKQARQYVYNVVHEIQENYSKHFVGLTFNEKVVLIDVIYNCHPNNIGYIAKQMRIEDKAFEKQETVYALSTLQYAKGVRYGGLVKRFNARVDLLFN